MMQGAWGMFDLNTWLTGALIFLARICDVRKAIRPLALDFTSWRAVFKRK